MAAFIDLTYYMGTFMGTAIPAASFSRYAIMASAAVEFQTFGSASVIILTDTDTATIDKIQMATCAAAEALYYSDQQASGTGRIVASERVGDHSVNYAVSPAASLTVDAKVSGAIREYLAFTGLMFRGFE